MFKVFQELSFYSHLTFQAYLLGLLGQHIFLFGLDFSVSFRAVTSASACSDLDFALLHQRLQFRASEKEEEKHSNPTNPEVIEAGTLEGHLP